jgi:hypothetical protein
VLDTDSTAAGDFRNGNAPPGAGVPLIPHFVNTGRCVAVKRLAARHVLRRKPAGAFSARGAVCVLSGRWIQANYVIHF